MTAPSTSQHPTSWQRSTTLFLGGQAITLFGSALVQFALLWHITMTTQSGSMMTITTLVGFLPMVLLAPFGGILADRYDRRHLIAGADALVAVSTLVLFAAFATGNGSYWMIFLVMAIRAIGAGIQMPAVGAMLPQIVPPEHLGRINGYNASMQAAVSLVSPLVAGALLSLLPIQWVLLIDVVTAIIGIAILLVWIHVPRPAGAEVSRDQHPLHELREGFDYIHHHRFIRRLIGYLALINFLSAPVAFLSPLLVTRTFGNDVWRLTTIETAFALGMVLGGILAGTLGTRYDRVTTMGVTMVLLGALTIALGLPLGFVIFNVWMFIAGLVLPSFSAPALTLIQLSADARYIGRVYSVVTMISVGATPFGMVAFGPFTDVFSVESILIFTGVLMSVTGVLVKTDRILHTHSPKDAGTSDAESSN